MVMQQIYVKNFITFFYQKGDTRNYYSNYNYNSTNNYAHIFIHTFSYVF